MRLLALLLIPMLATVWAQERTAQTIGTELRSLLEKELKVQTGS